MIIVDNLILSKNIGKGGYGEVFLSHKRGSNQIFATKRIEKDNDEETKKYLMNEITILKRLNHPNIVHLEDVKQTKTNYYIMMEYCNGGGLKDYLEKYISMYGKPFSEQIVQHIMRQLVDAIKYIHNRRIIHRDLKLDNILIHYSNEVDKASLNLLNAQVKIIDFGFAIYLDSNGLAYSALGSPMNMDPIILNEMNSDSNVLKGYNTKVDIWSLGTLCYEMLIGKPPFDAGDIPGLVKKVEKGTYSFPLNISKEVVSFLNGMIQYDNKKRLNANQLSRHHFLVKNVSEFTPINLTSIMNKIGGQGFKVNIKNNKTIWEIFNGQNSQNEQLLNNIDPCLLNPATTNENIYVDKYGDRNFFLTPHPLIFDVIPSGQEERTINPIIQTPTPTIQSNSGNVLLKSNTFNKNQRYYQNTTPSMNKNVLYGPPSQIYNNANNISNLGGNIQNQVFGNHINGSYYNSGNAIAPMNTLGVNYGSNINPKISYGVNVNSTINYGTKKLVSPGNDPDKYCFSSGIFPQKNLNRVNSAIVIRQPNFNGNANLSTFYPKY